ncbi:DUF559 domain-containing protein [Leucobacter iarius]|uniref:DUF559 domain-containing protein n=1 Tax=Leucobacter iarius TaxID=333963 RepID=A0ABN2LRZ4_9MICO
MTRTPRPLPGRYPNRALAYSDALRLGLTPDALRHRRFARPHRGVYRLREPTRSSADDAPGYLEDRVRHRAENYAPLLRPGEAFSHTTALLLLGCPIRCIEELHVTASEGLNGARGSGVIGHRTSGRLRASRDGSGLPRVPAVTALLQSAPLLDFRELVVAIDFLVLPRGPTWDTAPMVEHTALQQALRRNSGRGVRRARDAFEVSRIGAESRMESLLHFELARLGLDDLEMQAEISDEAGRWLGRFDLVDRARRLIIEYDGEQHRLDREQYLRDQSRLDRARAAGYRILRLHQEDFRPGNLARTRARLCEFLGRSPRTLSAALELRFTEV